MMFRVVVMLALVGVSLASVAIAPLAAKPDKFKDQVGCYIPELERVLGVGEKTPSTEGCFQHSCSENYVQLIGCGAIQAPEGCKLVSDKTKAFPYCCYAVSCPST